MKLQQISKKYLLLIVQVTSGFLVVGLIALFVFYRNQNYSYIELAENLINSYSAQQSTDNINNLEQLILDHEIIIKKLSAIRNYPFLPYEAAQDYKQKIELSLQQINEKKENLILLNESNQNFNEAQKLAGEAIDLAKNPPHSIEVWQNIIDKWQQAIIRLNKISVTGLDEKFLLEINNNRNFYEKNLSIANQSLENERTGKSLFATGQKLLNEAHQLSNDNLLTNKQNAFKKRIEGIKKLSDIPPGTTFSKTAEGKIKQHGEIVNVELKKREEKTDKKQPVELDKKPEVQLTNGNKIKNLIEDYFRTVINGDREEKYWCNSFVEQSFFSPTDYKILGDNSISNDQKGAIYKIRVNASNAAGQPIIGTYRFYFENKNDKWCIFAFEKVKY